MQRLPGERADQVLGRFGGPVGVRPELPHRRQIEADAPDPAEHGVERGIINQRPGERDRRPRPWRICGSERFAQQIRMGGGVEPTARVAEDECLFRSGADLDRAQSLGALLLCP